MRGKHPDPVATLPAIILAGGRATRMGGGDKTLLLLDGTEVLAHVIARLSPQAAPIALNANGDAARFQRFALPLLPDPMKGFPGPLAGILAALDWAHDLGAQQVVSVAADTPFFPPDLVKALIAAQGPEGLALAACPDLTGERQLQPTFGLWPVTLREDLRAFLHQGGRKVRQWAETHQAGIAFFDSRPFFNINTPADLDEANRLAIALQQDRHAL